MYKINFDDEKVFLEYLNSKDNLYNKREKILNTLLEIEDENNTWELDSLYGQLYNEKYETITSLNKVSHLIKSVKKINGEYFGYIQILKNYNGKILEELIKSQKFFHLEPIYYNNTHKKIIRLDIK
jgi:dolichyl-phosphate-mannose--protein O-mannosyl transferase